METMGKMNTFSSNFQELISIMTNPLSYIETGTKSSSESIESSMFEIIKKYQPNNQQNQPNQSNLEPIIELLKKIIPSELKIDYSDLMEYFVNVQKLQSNPVCSCYVRNHEKLEQYGDNDIVKSSELFMGFHCKTCGHFDSEHKACAKYIHTDDYWCEICGLEKSLHIICMNYDEIDDNCNLCGFSWHDHQNKCDSMKIEDCGNFIPHLECKSRCNKCIFNETHHKYSKKFHELNSKSKSKVADLWFHITADFISMTETERLALYSQYYMIAKMLTNSL